MLSLGCCSLFTVEIISYGSRISKSLFTLSCKCIGTLLARCFWKTESGLSGRCSGKCIFPTSILTWHKPWDILLIIMLPVQTLAWYC